MDWRKVCIFLKEVIFEHCCALHCLLFDFFGLIMRKPELIPSEASEPAGKICIEWLWLLCFVWFRGGGGGSRLVGSPIVICFVICYLLSFLFVIVICIEWLWLLCSVWFRGRGEGGGRGWLDPPLLFLQPAVHIILLLHPASTCTALNYIILHCTMIYCTVQCALNASLIAFWWVVQDSTKSSAQLKIWSISAIKRQWSWNKLKLKLTMLDYYCQEAKIILLNSKICLVHPCICSSIVALTFNMLPLLQANLNFPIINSNSVNLSNISIESKPAGHL